MCTINREQNMKVNIITYTRRDPLKSAVTPRNNAHGTQTEHVNTDVLCTVYVPMYSGRRVSVTRGRVAPVRPLGRRGRWGVGRGRWGVGRVGGEWAMNRGLLFATPPPPPLGGCERKD
jgi:hypothetical protein